MIEYVGKILLCNSKRQLRKLKKIIGGYFLPHPYSMFVVRHVEISN